VANVVIHARSHSSTDRTKLIDIAASRGASRHIKPGRDTNGNVLDFLGAVAEKPPDLAKGGVIPLLFTGLTRLILALNRHYALKV
jgi:hypothetical protein